MATLVFISYSSKDRAVADAACAALEARRFRCWIAPRDIRPGSEYGASILGAIESARVMVLILSSHSNASPQVIREVERAASRGVALLPFRVEAVALSPSMEYFVSSHQWLDAVSPPLERHLERLCDSVAALLAGPGAAPLSLQAAGGAAEVVPLHSAVIRVLVAVDGARETRSFDATRDRRVLLGSGTRNDIVLSAASGAAERHALLLYEKSGQWFAVDLGSAAGTMHNGARVSGRVAIAPGDTVSIGGSELRVISIEAAVPSERHLRLRVETDGSATDYTFDGEATPSVIVGRRRENEIAIRDGAASQRHTAFTFEGGRWFVVDLGSANGTYRNGKKLNRDAVAAGDVISIGQSRVVVASLA